MKLNTIPVNGITLAYSDQGEGTPVLFVHGFPLNQHMWLPQIEALSPQYRVLTLDLRGHGATDAPLWHFTLDDYADDIKGLLDHLNLSRVVLAGLSMGGYIIFSFYRKYPEYVRGLVLADTKAQPDNEEGRQSRFHMAQVAFREGTQPIADTMLLKLLCEPSRNTQPDLVQQVKDIIRMNPVSGIVVDLMAMAGRQDSRTLLSNITAPTMVIVGELDEATPPSDAQFMADHIPNAHLKIIPEAAHLPNLEQPEQFNACMKTFLQSFQDTN